MIKIVLLIALGVVFVGCASTKKDYNRGRADAIKEQYWMLQAIQGQNPNEQSGSLRTYEVVVPGGKDPDGIRMVPEMVKIPIYE